MIRHFISSKEIDLSHSAHRCPAIHSLLLCTCILNITFHVYLHSHPVLQRHMSDFGPRRDPWDSYSGGGGRRRGGGGGGWGGGGGDYGRRRYEDLGPPRSSHEDWNKPLPRNERVER